MSLLGFPLALLARASGGSWSLVDGVLEAHGGALTPLLGRLVPRFPIAALTLGHVVLGLSPDVLDETRAHERAHVRQAERWGVLFPVLYLGASLLAFTRGGHFWRDNRFEREAFARETSARNA